jgi:glutamate/aspartate transport system substrate-binding protein
MMGMAFAQLRLVFMPCVAVQIEPINAIVLHKVNFMKKQFIAAAVTLAISTFAFAQADDTLNKVKASGEVTMGVRDSSGALSYTLGNGKYTGYHVEICQAILVNLEKAVGKKLTIKYQSVTSQNRINLLLNGTIDIECGSTTNNLLRQREVAFANTTFVEEVRIAVKANSGIKSIAQLNGKNVATTTGTTSVQTLRKNERATGVDFKEIFGRDHAESFLLLESGRADAFVMDGSILAGNIATSKKPTDFKIVGEVLSVEPIAIMMRKDDPWFKKLANSTIAGMVQSGAIAKLYDKWFMQPIPPKNTRVGLAASDNIKAAWANPNDKPMEDYAKK